MLSSKTKTSILTLTIFTGLAVLAACASSQREHSEKRVAITAPGSQDTFFMSRPMPTEPTELVFDVVEGSRKLKNYLSQPSMRFSSSGSFGAEGISALKKILPKKDVQLLQVLDLRQEPHGLINDKAVTWLAPHNWTNASANREEALQREKRLLSELTVGSEVAGVQIQSVESFASLIRSSGINYDRLSVVQHLRPTDLEVDAFIGFIRNLPVNAWVHFVDYEGNERAAEFMLMYDLLNNAGTADLESFYNKYRKLYNKENLFTLSVESSNYYKYENEKLKFFERFYTYAKKNPKGVGQLWGEFLLQK